MNPFLIGSLVVGGIILWGGLFLGSMVLNEGGLSPSGIACIVGTIALTVFLIGLYIKAESNDARTCARYEYRTVMMPAGKTIIPTQQRHCVEYWENVPGEER